MCNKGQWTLVKDVQQSTVDARIKDALISGTLAKATHFNLNIIDLNIRNIILHVSNNL
jgi:hypothetical protein